MKGYRLHWQGMHMTISHNGTRIGSIGSGLGYSDGTFAIGYGVDEDYHNKGVMTWALGEYLKGIACTELQAIVRPNNPASKKVLVKNGFELVICSNKDDLFPTYEVYVWRSKSAA